MFKHSAVWNAQAEDSNPAGWISPNEITLSNLIRQGIQPTPLLVCAGGTSSRCAGDGLWTVDLRHQHRQLFISADEQEVEIGTGLSMDEVVKGLKTRGLSIPVGLSTVPGCGFILTGGIGPLSRSKGLALDQVVGLKGVWGNGQIFNLSLPSTERAERVSIQSDDVSRKQWRGLLGAAPFLAFVTAIRLRTQTLTPLAVWRSVCTTEQLAIAIEVAERWTNSCSLQWAWNERTELFVVCCADDSPAMKAMELLRTLLGSTAESSLTIVAGQFEQPDFGTLARVPSKTARFHSEVISRLGPAWGQQLRSLIAELNQLMSVRPHPGCQICAQQLGQMSSQVSVLNTSFIHRDAIWKPWITAAWTAGDNAGRELALQWLLRVNTVLTQFCPGVHLAQIHPHLSFHEKELDEAFQDWLPGLKQLKTHFDPDGLLPPLTSSPETAS